MKTTVFEALERLQRFVEADPDLVWMDGGWEASRDVAPVYDAQTGGRHMMPGQTTTTLTLRVAFMSHDKTAIEEMGECVGRHEGGDRDPGSP